MIAESKTIYNKAWSALKELVEKEGHSIKKDCATFCEDCFKLEEEIKNQYMVKDTQLDRHKLAGVIAVCASSGDYITTNKEVNDDQVFLGKYIYPLHIAMTLVEEDLNMDLENSNLLFDGKIELTLPNPSVCKTKGMSADARMLYWQDLKDVDLCIRVLSLANTLFLYEEYNLLLYDIDLSCWKAYKQNAENV